MSLTCATIYEVTTLRSSGKFEENEARFVSTDVLSGQTLKIDLGLFLPNYTDTSNGPAWSITYPTTPGVYEVPFQGISTSENYRVELEVIDSLNFWVRAKFIFRADTQKFVSEGGANNPDSFTSFSFSGDTGNTVYNGVRYFAIRAEVNEESAIFFRPYGANFFNNTHSLNYETLINGTPSNGYVIGQDLVINFDISTDLADAGYDVAIIRVDDISPGGSFVAAHELNYGRMSDAIAQVDELPYEALKAATPINNSVPGFSSGSVTIDGSHFVEGATYQLYIVYKVLGLNLTVKTEDITASPNSTQYEPTYGTISCSVGAEDCQEANYTGFMIPGGQISHTVSLVNTDFEIDTIVEVLDGSGNPLVFLSINSQTITYLGSYPGGQEFEFTLLLTDGNTVQFSTPAATSITPTSGTVEICSWDQLETCCIEGVCPEEFLKLCVSMDEDEYNANANANGVSGDYETNLVAITAGVVDQLGDPPFSFDTPLSVDALGCVNFTVPSEWANSTKYVVFVYHFDLGTHQDFIYQPFRLTIGNDGLDAAITNIVDEDNNELRVLCNEEEGTLTVTLQGDFTDCDLEVTIGELGSDSFRSAPVTLQNVTDTGAEAVIDLSLLGDYEDKTYCLRLRCAEEPVDDGGGCAGECFEMTLTQTTVTGGQTATINFAFTAPADVDSFQVSTDSGAGAQFADSGDFNFNVPAPGPMVPVQYTIVATRGGCVFTTQVILNTCNVDGDEVEVTFNICNEPPEPSCLNSIGILTGCDPSGGPGAESITAEAYTADASNIDTTTFEFRVNELDPWAPYTGGTPVIGNYAEFRLTVTFTDGCKTLTAYESVQCLGNTQLFCLNEPALSECVFDADAETVTVTDVGTYNSAIIDPNLDYSLDAGETWTAITGPVSTSGLDDGQVILFRLDPIYADGCPQGPPAFRECVYNENFSSCDYSGFTLSCAVDDSTFTPTFDGDDSALEVSLKEFSENGGASWSEYSGVPVTSAAQTVIFRWELKYSGCDTEVLITACTKDCTFDFPTDLNVTITNPSLTVNIPECIGVYDCLDNCEVDAGTPTDAGICDPAFPFKS